MGCQIEIAKKIVQRKAHYCLAAKGNQPTLHQGIVDFFHEHLEDDFARVKVRRYGVRSRVIRGFAADLDDFLLAAMGSSRN